MSKWQSFVKFSEDKAGLSHHIEEFEKQWAASHPSDTFTFGRFRGEKIVDVMRLDAGRTYCKWVVKQEFAEKYPGIVATILKLQSEPEKLQ